MCDAIHAARAFPADAGQDSSILAYSSLTLPGFEPEFVP